MSLFFINFIASISLFINPIARDFDLGVDRSEAAMKAYRREMGFAAIANPDLKPSVFTRVVFLRTALSRQSTSLIFVADLLAAELSSIREACKRSSTLLDTLDRLSCEQIKDLESVLRREILRSIGNQFSKLSLNSDLITIGELKLLKVVISQIHHLSFTLTDLSPHPDLAYVLAGLDRLLDAHRRVDAYLEQFELGRYELLKIQSTLHKGVGIVCKTQLRLTQMLIFATRRSP